MTESVKFGAIRSYAVRLADALREFDWATVEGLASDLLKVWPSRSTPQQKSGPAISEAAEPRCATPNAAKLSHTPRFV
jgi:hypothetical protein